MCFSVLHPLPEAFSHGTLSLSDLIWEASGLRPQSLPPQPKVLSDTEDMDVQLPPGHDTWRPTSISNIMCPKASSWSSKASAGVHFL